MKLTGGGMKNICEQKEINMGFWWEHLKNLIDLSIDGWVLLKQMLKKEAGRAKTVLTWVRIETDGRLP
jgi:hypothetical protein